MADSNTQTTGKTPVPALDTDNSKLKPGTSGGSPPPASPASLAPPESSTGSVLSRPVSPIEKEKREFTPTPSTLEQPETPSPKSYYHLECPRSGLAVSSAQERIAEGIPIGSRLYVHDDPDRLNHFQKPRRGFGRILSPSPSTQVQVNEPSTTTTGSSQDPNSLPPIAAAVTAGPIILVENKPCLIIPSPMPEDRWRATASAIVEKFDKHTTGDKMVEKTGKYLNPLRNPATKPRKNSIIDGVKSVVNVSLVATRGTMRPSTKVGRVWACSMGCETLSCRKRDWALVELDPNVVGSRERRNEVLVGGRTVQLKPPKKEKPLKPGTRVVLATVDSRTVPVTGVVGERQPLVFGYHMVQKITLDKGCTVADGDAGACVVDEESGRFYGILVMMGMLSKDVEAGKKAGKKEEGVSGESVAWFVPYQTIITDIGESFPIEFAEFPDSAKMGGE